MARALVPVDSTDTRLIIHFGKQKVGLYVVYKRIVHFTSTISIKSELHDDVGALSKEIEKLYTYWHTLKENIGQPDKQISQIIMCGEDIQETVPAYLSQNHHTPAVVGNVWQNAFAISENIPPVPFVDSLRFSAAVGLALPDEILI